MEENTNNMLQGLPYTPQSAELTAFRTEGHRLCAAYNQTLETETGKRASLLQQLVPQHGHNCCLQGPIQFDYGRFTTIGDNFYANFNLTVLDTCPVTIGDNVMFGPNVTLTTASHPLRYQQRNARVNEDGELFDYELGAGSVVTKDVPKDALVVGVPGRVVRIISAADRLENFPY
ncbi:maltose acetyltransferase domain-containing protein [Limosilactobacillus fermentum]|uniref:maltose acetyltransferase domain-containing protein n=1 Tax=Limosilactobacillus fermentum TaxID=1613 RepID=UPI0021824960|nr:maltose acetyltransferase domain-containing protein [Limosilactobacillus fermentum]MCS8619177.1 sugar O-acetyltransferase [Limosilactobacillus fermentum]